MEPREDGVGIDVVVEVGEKIPEHESLIPCAVGGHPEPTVPEIVVDEENIALLKPVRRWKDTLTCAKDIEIQQIKHKKFCYNGSLSLIDVIRST